MVDVKELTTQNKAGLMRSFDFFTRRMRPVLDKRYGSSLAGQMFMEGRDEFERIIPLMPDTGSRGILALFSNATSMYLAMYRVVLSHGKSLEETGRVIYDTAEYFMDRVPFVFARLFAGMNFHKKYLDTAKKRAEESKKKSHPRGYVFDFIEGDGKSFDYGINYLECASVKFLKAQGAPELAPYLCPIDILYSNKFGWGLKRTMTLADGDPKCDFRFKRGGKTDIVVKTGYPLPR